MRSSFGVITTSPGCSDGQQRRALRPVAERLGSRHAAFDEHLVDRQAVHLGVAGDDALLHVEAFALVGLHDGARRGRSRRRGRPGQGMRRSPQPCVRRRRARRGLLAGVGHGGGP